MVAKAEPSCCVWMMTTFTASAQAENRAEFAERSVAKLEKTIDDLEGTVLLNPLTQCEPVYPVLNPLFSLLICTSVFSPLCLCLCLSLLTNVQMNCTIRS